jgi:uncharacterized protein YuzE
VKVHYDEKADAVYFRLDDSKIVDSSEVRPGIVLDYDAHDRIVGIEILRVKSSLPAANLRQLIFEVA